MRGRTDDTNSIRNEIPYQNCFEFYLFVLVNLYKNKCTLLLTEKHKIVGS